MVDLIALPLLAGNEKLVQCRLECQHDGYLFIACAGPSTIIQSCVGEATTHECISDAIVQPSTSSVVTRPSIGDLIAYLSTCDIQLNVGDSGCRREEYSPRRDDSES